jgi:hypothetical protein
MHKLTHLHIPLKRKRLPGIDPTAFLKQKSRGHHLPAASVSSVILYSSTDPQADV